MPSEVRQTEEDKYCTVSPTHGIQLVKHIEIESRVLFSVDEGVGELEGCWLKGANFQF